MNHSLGDLLAQKNNEGFEQAIYYLSRTLIGGRKSLKPSREKKCLALVFAIQRTHHYLVSQSIHVIFRVNPLRILKTKSGSLNFRLANWAILLSQYDMTFVPQKAILFSLYWVLCFVGHFVFNIVFM